MIYNILGCIIGVFALVNTGIIFFTKRERLSISIWNLLCALGFLVTSIVGFIIPDKYSLVPVILLVVFAVAYLILNTFFLKKGKTSQTGITNSSKK